MGLSGSERLREILAPDRPTVVVDIGANPIDGDPPYATMLRRGWCKVIGFEPQQAALDELNRQKSQHEEYLPVVVGDGESHTLHVTQASGMTSLLMPDETRLALFNRFAEWGTVRDRHEVPTVRLDEIEMIGDADLVKIDVQGAERLVFANAAKVLQAAVAIQTEVSFVPLYQHQPTFGDIDQMLRQAAFLPHAQVALKRWPLAPVIFDGDPCTPMHQVLEADMVYVRDFGRLDDLSLDKVVHLALIADCVYGSVDLAHLCLINLVKRGRVDAAAPASYLASLVYTGN